MLATREYLRTRFGLTGRQSEIAILIGLGKSNLEIASELCISTHTVRHHAEQILTKMQVRSRAQVAAQLHPPMTSSGGRSQSRRAHDLYLRGRFELHRRGNHLVEAIRFFEEAIEEDPGFAAAHGALALALAIAVQHDVLSPEQGEDRVRRTAAAALALDPLLSDPRVALSFMEVDLERAERELRRALELNPSHATALNRLAQVIAHQGRLEEAMAFADRAVEVEPVSAMHRAIRGRVLFWSRSYDEAEEDLLEAIRMDPDLRIAHVWLARVYEAAGRHEQAAEWIARFRSGEWMLTPEEELALVRGGECPPLRSVAIAALHRLRREGRGAIYELAASAAHVGAIDLALEWLEEAEREAGYSSAAGVDPRFDSLRGNPRFIAAAVRLGAPVSLVRGREV